MVNLSGWVRKNAGFLPVSKHRLSFAIFSFYFLFAHCVSPQSVELLKEIMLVASVTNLHTEKYRGHIRKKTFGLVHNGSKYNVIMSNRTVFFAATRFDTLFYLNKTLSRHGHGPFLHTMLFLSLPIPNRSFAREVMSWHSSGTLSVLSRG